MEYDAAGNLIAIHLVGDANCDGVLNFNDIDAFVMAIVDPDGYALAYPECAALMVVDLDGNGIVNFDDLDYFVALLSNGGGGVQALLSWDAENRLVAYTPSFPQAGDQKIVFSYDYRNRRIAKLVYDWDTQTSDWSATATLHTKYVYDGHRLLLELDGLNSDATVRQYTWGLDLSGSRGSAGGIGGLLAVSQAEVGGGAGAGGLDAGDYAYTHDANGNVAQAIAWDSGFGSATDNEWHADRLVAHYEYAPFGGVISAVAAGSFAEANPFRFSTKYYDTETGLVDYGERLYSPSLGRWLSRDPIGPLGGPNVYTFAGNNPIDRIDPFGMMYIPCPGGNCGGGGGDDEPTTQPTTQPTSGPTTNPSTPPPTQPDCGLDDALDDAGVKKLRAKLKKCADKEVPIRCGGPDECKDPGGYYDGSEIVLCSGASDTAAALRHELIHELQSHPKCLKLPVPLDDGDKLTPQRVACQEIQAANCDDSSSPGKKPTPLDEHDCGTSLLDWCERNPGACEAEGCRPPCRRQKNGGDAGAIIWALRQCQQAGQLGCSDCKELPQY